MQLLQILQQLPLMGKRIRFNTMEKHFLETIKTKHKEHESKKKVN